MQLERQVVVEISDAGRIHRQLLGIFFLWLSLAGRETNQRVVLLEKSEVGERSDSW
jgi:hypothetical protein